MLDGRFLNARYVNLSCRLIDLAVHSDINEILSFNRKFLDDQTSEQNFVRKFICPKSGDARMIFRPKVLYSLKIEKYKETLHKMLINQYFASST